MHKWFEFPNEIEKCLSLVKIVPVPDRVWVLGTEQCFPVPAFFKLTWLWLWLELGSDTLTLTLTWAKSESGQSQVSLTVKLTFKLILIFFAKKIFSKILSIFKCIKVIRAGAVKCVENKSNKCSKMCWKIENYSFKTSKIIRFQWTEVSYCSKKWKHSISILLIC